MSYTTVRRFAASPEKAPFVPHDRYDPDRWTGSIGLRWDILEAHPVFIGDGHLAFEEEPVVSSIPLIEPPRRARSIGNMKGAAVQQDFQVRTQAAAAAPPPEIVMELVRRGSLPVLPGSSLGGAVRQAYELLSPSCNLDRGACQIAPRVRVPAADQLCPACSLFGAAGYGGRAAFGEGTAASTEFLFTTVKVPEGWNHPGFVPEPNTYRIHCLTEDTEQDGQPRAKNEKVRAVWGFFHSQLFLTNVTEDEIGILLLALGLGSRKSPGFRLGGKKYHGLGGVDIKVEIVERYWPMSAPTWEANPEGWAAELRDRAFQDSGRAVAWDRWQKALRHGQGGEENG